MNIKILIILHRHPVSKVSTIIFNWMVKFNICSKPIRTYDVGAPSAITISLPGMDPADAERRRCLIMSIIKYETRHCCL